MLEDVAEEEEVSAVVVAVVEAEEVAASELVEVLLGDQVLLLPSPV